MVTAETCPSFSMFYPREKLISRDSRGISHGEISFDSTAKE